MTHLITIIATVLVFVTAMFLTEHHRNARQQAQSVPGRAKAAGESENQEVLRAAGRIEGRTDDIELRARVDEQVRKIHVTKGQWVTAGEVLIELDADRLAQERDLAVALLVMAEAKRERVKNGYRASEIETARQLHRATAARLAGAEKAYARAVKLSKTRVISQQTVDDRRASVNALRATAAAALGKLETYELSPRADDLMVASAAVRAAESRRNIAIVNLDRAQIRAPSDGRVLAVEAEVGELTGPESPLPLIVLSDTTELRTMAEVDEFDALKVRIGQRCHITSDAADGILGHGRIVEIEPRMYPKRLFGQWAGERSDTYSRRVWIELEGPVDLPVGLPVDVFIAARSEL